MAKHGTRRRAAEDREMSCPCGSGRSYPRCCGPLHRGEADAPTAEALMRSRFSAFAVGDTGYLLRSWHERTRPSRLDLDPGRRWLRLEIVDTERGGLLDSTGTVEFRAYHRTGGHTGMQSERSRFVRADGRWVYLDAEQE
ncbi:YchJ family protein [Micromonospora avicenniae]|uniref:YchJ family protein n=1 Tax=Micromonospora avicenniae TaxID=1198245 RepID=UPI00331DE1C0